ncbi:MAG: aspartyl-tRNA amidotransferase subunit B [Cyclobacteriaceae bacterium]|nr:MAG: aspartyl-tRNA amidotransferase subunit B [Cyclobacteriaceae bacterium]
MKMSLKKHIEEDLKNAIRNQNKDETRALRGIKSMILLLETEKGASGELSEDAELGLLSKALKQRKDSAQLYSEQGREDLAAIELSEIEIINKYLPKQLTEDQLTEKLREIISQLGASGPKDMGKVMGLANKSLKGKADGGTIAGIVRTLLN